MKKIISSILLIAIVASLFTTVSFAAPKGMEIAEKVQLLQKVDVLPDGDDIELDKAITRGEFVKLLAKLLKIDTNVVCEDRYYADLGEDDELWNVTAQLVKQGILTVSYDRKFRPNDIINYKEAACALMKGYGAGEMEYDMYSQIAIRMNLFENVSYGDMDYKDAINLLFNALVGTPLTFTGNGIGPGEKTLMEIKYDMFYVRGIVNSVNESVIDGGSAKADTIRVGDVLIGHKESNLYQYLGKEVGAFYTSEDDPQLVYVYSYVENEDIVEITERNHPEFYNETYTLKYFNENERSKKIKLSNAVSVIFNGEDATDDVLGAFESFTTGKITLLKSKNGECDTVIIDNYYNISIMSVSVSEGIIYGKGGEKIDLANDSRTVLIQDVNGNVMSLEQIQEGNVASIFESDSYLKLVVSTTIVAGSIARVSNDDPVKLTVSGTEYELFPGKDFAYALGSQVSLHLDAYGYVFEISAQRKDGLTYGWIVDHKMIEKDGEDLVQLKIFTEKGNFVKVTLPEKIRIDGTLRKTPDLQLFGLEQGKSSIVDQMILFKADSNNVATEIDTVFNNGTGEGLFKEFGNSEGTYGSASVGKLIWAETSTVVFVLPSAENREIEDAYAIGTRSLLEAWKNNEVESYRSADKDKPAAAEVLVLRRDMYNFASTQRGAYVVGEMRSEWDEQEDEIRNIVTMMSGSSTKEFVLADNFDDMDCLEKGNIVTIGINGKKELSTVTLEYGTDDVGNEVKVMKELGSWSDSNHYVAIGKVVSVGDSYADLSITADGAPTVRFPITTTNIGVFEADEEKMCRVGTKGDIAEAMMQEDIVVVSMYRGTMVSIAIVKR